MNTPPADTAPALPPPRPVSLNDILQKYNEKPDLLELILLSKVEEDRRRTEEIKLRSKQIDYMLQKPSSSSCCSPHLLSSQQKQRSSSSPHLLQPITRTSSPDPHQHSAASPTAGVPHNQRRASMYPQYYPPSPPSMGTSAAENKPLHASSSAPAVTSRGLPSMECEVTPPTPSSLSTPLGNTKRRRRRQKMQAVTKTVETRDFPYHDDYLWKNNGNTVHKVSGTKSIYYKCANHPKGCPVNKTVTFREHGRYLIKYRGEHLSTCHRIKRVIDV